MSYKLLNSIQILHGLLLAQPGAHTLHGGRPANVVGLIDICQLARADLIAIFETPHLVEEFVKDFEVFVVQGIQQIRPTRLQ